MAEKILNARVFVKAVLMTDGQCDAAVTSQQLPTAGWVQVNTKGSVELSHDRATLEVGNDQSGTTGLFTDVVKRSMKIPFSAKSFDTLAQYCVVDPNYDTDDYYFKLGSDRGTEITGISILVYDKDLDPTNETNVPNLSLADQSARLLFDAAINASITEKWDGTQNILEATFDALANTGSGSARGYQGIGGRLTAV